MTYSIWGVSASVLVGEDRELAGHAMRRTNDTIGLVQATASVNMERREFILGYDYLSLDARLCGRKRLPWHPKKFGLSVKSVESSLYQMFLSYKIERPELDDEGDVAMSLNALTPNPVHIDDCALELDDRKLRYLRQAQGSALTHAGLAEFSADELTQRIKAQFRGGYVYSMGRSREDDTLKFNVIVEDRRRPRVQCGLKYFPAERRVSVITLF